MAIGKSQYRQTEGSFFPEGFRDVPVWSDLSDAIDLVFGDNINAAIAKLQDMRDASAVVLDPDTQRSYLLKFLHFLGLWYKDVDVLTDDNIKTFIDFLPYFWPEKGTRDFINFMSFAVNALLTMQILWTEDYVNFYPEGSSSIGTPIWQGGTWYPTSHVYIQYDTEKFANSVSSDFSSDRALQNFFYAIAPINLVIKSFLVTSTAQVNLNWSVAFQTRIFESTQNVTATTA